jgi:GIY-YIG catalytic domain/AP2 domain
MTLWLVYCHTHIASGRRYIGITAQTMEKRWKNHIHAAQSSKGKWYFPNAIRKYGKEAFSHYEFPVKYSTLEEANKAEEFAIEFFCTRDPDFGFNLKRGGAHTPHPIKNPWDRPEYRIRCTEASRARQRDPVFRAKSRQSQRLSLQNPMIQAKRASASKRKWEDPRFANKITKAITNVWKNPAYRSKMSAVSKEINSRPEVKQKISIAQDGRPKSSQYRGVCWNKALFQWRVSFRHNGKMLNLGHFKEEKEAALAYDAKVKMLYGESARLNFPA